MPLGVATPGSAWGRAPAAATAVGKPSSSKPSREARNLGPCAGVSPGCRTEELTPCPAEVQPAVQIMSINECKKVVMAEAMGLAVSATLPTLASLWALLDAAWKAALPGKAQLGVGEEAHHAGVVADLFAQALEHVGALPVPVASPWRVIEGEGLLDVRLHPIHQFWVLALSFCDPGSPSPAAPPASLCGRRGQQSSFEAVVVAGLAGQVAQGLTQQVHVRALPEAASGSTSRMAFLRAAWSSETTRSTAAGDISDACVAHRTRIPARRRGPTRAVWRGGDGAACAVVPACPDTDTMHSCEACRGGRAALMPAPRWRQQRPMVMAPCWWPDGNGGGFVVMGTTAGGDSGTVQAWRRRGHGRGMRRPYPALVRSVA